MDSIAAIVQRAAQEKAKLGFANGCFDCLHDGHLYLLTEARKYCDLLIVAVNSDASVHKLKGKGRPVDKLHVRMAKILKTRLADTICSFENETELLGLVKSIKPAVMVKGDDYLDKSITAAGWVQDNGGKVILIKRMPGLSTTGGLND